MSTDAENDMKFLKDANVVELIISHHEVIQNILCQNGNFTVSTINPGKHHSGIRVSLSLQTVRVRALLHFRGPRYVREQTISSIRNEIV